MKQHDLFDDLDFTDLADEYTCKYCNADDLHWEEARGAHNKKSWVLCEDDDTIHHCPGMPSAASADEFNTLKHKDR